MAGLIGLSRIIDRVNELIGKWVAWLILVAIIVSAANATVRKTLNMSSNAWLELQWVLFGAVFLLCSPWTLMSNEHIRIDIVNSRLSKGTRNWIDLLGHAVFLLPFCVIMVITSWPFAQRSFLLNEQSLNAGGLPQWPAKFLVFLGFVLLTAQGISEFIKRLAIMRGDLEDTTSGGGHHEAAEAEARRLLEVTAAEADAKLNPAR
jgi:TRAP-type mannitol/chloroaromatic compound transport system permease small subunit